jgi:hypothetical protein
MRCMPRQCIGKRSRWGRMMSWGAPLLCMSSGVDVVSHIVARFVKAYTVIHTAHVGSWFGSSKSSLAAAAAVSESSAPAVCANAVRTEENRQRIAVKCMVELGRSYFAMGYNDAGGMSKKKPNDWGGQWAFLGSVYVNDIAARLVHYCSFHHTPIPDRRAMRRPSVPISVRNGILISTSRLMRRLQLQYERFFRARPRGVEFSAG